MIHQSRVFISPVIAKVAVSVAVSVLTIIMLCRPVFASESLRGPGPIRHASPGFKVPSKLTARMAIDQNVKDFLDRDFRSRYPVASPLKIDVVQADVQLYTVSNVLNGYGGFDERHSFRVVVDHADRSMVTIDITVYHRSTHEPDQEPLLLEWFRVISVVR